MACKRLFVILFALLVNVILGSDVNEVNIAYFIQVSEATITLVPRLLRVLWHPKNTYIVHFDKKIPDWQREHATASILRSKQNARYRANVFVLPPEVITYRGISMVINSMSAMQAAVDRSEDWDFFINISGSDYPLISPTNQRLLLAENDFKKRARSFLSISVRSWWTESKGYRYTRLFTDTSLSMNGTQAELIDSYTAQPLASRLAFEFVAAESWMILHRSLVKYLLTSAQSRRYFAAFAYAAEPEEHYFATVAYNTPEFNSTLVRHAMRNVNWMYKGKHAGQHPYFVDASDSNGKWIFKDTVKDSGCFFTRKISIENSKFLDWIDTELNGVADNAQRDKVDENLQRARSRLECISQKATGEEAAKCFLTAAN